MQTTLNIVGGTTTVPEVEALVLNTMDASPNMGRPLRKDQPMSAEPALPPPAQNQSTAERAYADRLNRLQGKRWKKLLNVQLPWKLHIKRLNLGRTLDVGCGNGRNLTYLRSDSVGVDHNAYSVATARSVGGTAFTVDEFFASPELARPDSFDSLLAAHLIEHLEPAEARSIIGSYLPMLKPGGRAIFITPQERGYASDETHVVFVRFEELRALCDDLGLVTEKSYSFPFFRWLGKLFIYNEFVLIARKPASTNTSSVE
jgi:SAM-dependent methyltransferase